MGTKTQKSRLKFKDGNLKQACFLMCRYSNSLANQALWEIKENYKNTQKMTSHIDIDKKIKNDSRFIGQTGTNYNDNYLGLIANGAQHTIRNVHDSYKSFFALLKLKQSGKYEPDVKEPGFKKSGGLFKVIYAKNQYGYNKETHEIKLGISSKVKQELRLQNNAFITHKLPGYIAREDINEVRLQPNNGGKFYHVEIVYGAGTKKSRKEAVKPAPKERKGFLGIDLGVNNLATCVNGQNGESFIFDGKKIKSYNAGYNKRMAKIQSVKDQLGMKCQYTNRQKVLNENRYWFVQNYFNQIIAKIVDYCIDNDITDVFVGKNIGWKTKTNMGKKNNQKFLAIPHAKLIDKLVSKCEEHGLRCHAQEESHTSKCSFLDREPICHQEKYKGRRVKRGLFKTSQKVVLNADSNGGANILMKGLQSLKVSAEIIAKAYDGVCNGLVNNPVRLRLESNFQLLNEATA